jgi:hypothetical protein
VSEGAPTAGPVDESNPTTVAWGPVAVAIALGVALGVLSLAGDVVSDEGPTIILNGLANATAPWTLVAFVAGVLQRRPRMGALAGAGALLVAVATYYVTFVLVWGGDRLADVRFMVVVWLVAATVAGAVMGAAGGVQARPDPRLRAVGLSLVCGALLAEAVYLLVQLEVWNGIDLSRTYLVVAVFDIFVAVLIPIVLGQRGSRAVTYLGSVGLAIVGYVAISVVFALIRSGAFRGA